MSDTMPDLSLSRADVRLIAAQSTGRRLGLTREERDRLSLDLAAWGDWVRDGRRPREPLPSGVASAIRYDRPSVVTGKPGSSAPRGCLDDNDESLLGHIDATIDLLRRVNPAWYALAIARYANGQSVTDTAAVARVNRSTITRQWTQLYVWLYVRVYG